MRSAVRELQGADCSPPNFYLEPRPLLTGFVFRGKTTSRREMHSSLDQAASPATFCFLRQPSRPNVPTPVAKRGSAAGSGVAAEMTPFSRSWFKTNVSPEMLTYGSR